MPRIPEWVLAALTFCAVAAALLWNAQPIGRLMAQVYEWFIPLTYGHFDRFSVSLAGQSTESVYLLQAINSEPFEFAGKPIPAQANPSSQTLLAHTLQHLLFFALVLSAGVWRQRFSLLRLVTSSALLLVLLELLDVPFVLTGAIEDLMVANLGSDGFVSHIRVKWMDFLNNGGRIGLSLGFAWLALVFAARPQAENEAKSGN